MRMTQRSTLFGRMTKSRMVIPLGRVTIKSTASATSVDCIRLPLASASSSHREEQLLLAQAIQIRYERPVVQPDDAWYAQTPARQI